MDVSGVASVATLVPVTICAAIGYMIDSWIGKSGQIRVKDWLETYWLKASYLRIGVFGEQEASYALRLLDEIFGSKILSIKRLKATILCGIFSLLIGLLPYYVILRIEAYARHLSYHVDFEFFIPQSVFFMLSLLAFSLSISLSRLLLKVAIIIIRRLPQLNLLVFVSILVIQYIIFCVWTPLVTSFLTFGPGGFPGVSPFEFVASVRALLIEMNLIRVHPLNGGFEDINDHDYFNFIGSLSLRHQFYLLWYYATGPIQFGKQILHPDVLFPPSDQLPTQTSNGVYLLDFSTSGYFLGLIPNFARILFALIFCVSYLIALFHKTLLELWAEIVETKKPIFFVLLGGGAALAQALEAIYKSFH